MMTTPKESGTLLIKKLNIVNFKNYGGANEFDLSTDPQKNIILIGGMNGSGKTTISEAIQLCLYGSKMNGIFLSENKYNKYLSEVWSKNSDGKEMYVSMDVEIQTDSVSIDFTIRREFKKTKNGFAESLSLTKDGRDIELIDRNYWDFYIDKMVPSRVSKYFFFDGEVVRNIIASEKSSDYLIGATKDLTGVSDIEKLQLDLSEVRKRISRSNVKSSILKQIENLETKMMECDHEIALLRSEEAHIAERRGAFVDKRREIDDELRRILGTNEKVKNELIKELESLKSKYSELNNKIQDSLYFQFTKRVCADLIRDMLDAAEKENQENYSIIFSEYNERKTKELKEKISEIVMEKTMLKEIEDEINNIFYRTPPSNSIIQIIDLTHNQIQQIKREVEEISTSDLFYDFQEREDLNIRIKNIEKKILRHSDFSITSFEEEFLRIDDGIADFDEKIKEIRIKISLLEQSNSKLYDEIQSEERNLVVSQRDRAAISVIDETQNSLQKRSEKLLEENRIKLEKNTNIMYSSLKNKKDMIQKIIINEDFSISLLGYKKDIVNIKWISEGEKGILMYSVLYGLLSIFEAKTPLIIDSPLGRMDSDHVNNLVEKFYTSINSQLIILSHDREITTDNLLHMEKMISKKYLIGNKIPKIKEGYFE